MTESISNKVTAAKIPKPVYEVNGMRKRTRARIPKAEVNVPLMRTVIAILRLKP